MNYRIGKNKRLFFLFFVFLSFIFSPYLLSAQSGAQPWWLPLEKGKQRFRANDYGDALLLFEDARRIRRVMYEHMERDFINFLSIGEVRRIGDSLERIEKYSYDRFYTSVSNALEELFFRVPRLSLNNSALSALEAIGRLKNYPEAEYWIGEVYRVEGELSLALNQYRRALANHELLEDPDFVIELQYRIAGILRIRQEYNEMERTLHLIIAQKDTLWTNALRGDVRRLESPNAGRNSPPVSYSQASASFASQAMTRTLETDGINRFLELYRYNNGTVEQAHRLLGFHYAATGRPSAQQHLMHAFLIQNTIIIEELVKHQFDFRFTTLAEERENQARNLSELMKAASGNNLLLSYINEVEYFKTAYYLSLSLYGNGKISAARELWIFLASLPQAGEWQGRAAMQLRNPRMESVVEMP
jgi:tetratricopeptide (TPR) repeat protein